jgi:hypothetical protein
MRTNAPPTIRHPRQPDRCRGPTLILIRICEYIKISSNVYLFLFLLAITGPHWLTKSKHQTPQNHSWQFIMRRHPPSVSVSLSLATTLTVTAQVTVSIAHFLTTELNYIPHPSQICNSTPFATPLPQQPHYLRGPQCNNPISRQ